MTWAAVPDLHAPHTDPRALEWGLKVLKDYKPDVVVLLGDLLEAESASKFLKEDPASLEDEFSSAAKTLEAIGKATGRARRVFLEGNHDDNVRAVGRLPKALRSLCDPRRHDELGKLLKTYEVKPYVNSPDGAFWLGQVCFKHGYSMNETREALQFAGPAPYTLVVGGHTHRPVAPTQVKWGKQGLYVWYANGGTWGPLQPEWASRDNCRDWGHAMVLGRSRRDGLGKMEKLWEAETIWRPSHGLGGLAGNGRRRGDL